MFNKSAALAAPPPPPPPSLPSSFLSTLTLPLTLHSFFYSPVAFPLHPESTIVVHFGFFLSRVCVCAFFVTSLWPFPVDLMGTKPGRAEATSELVRIMGKMCIMVIGLGLGLGMNWSFKVKAFVRHPPWMGVNANSL